MNLLAGIYLLIIVGLVFYTGIRLVALIGANYLAGRRVKEAFAERIKMLRLNRMLKKRQIAPADYLHRFSVPNLEQQIRACESCLKTTDCDRFLSGETSDGDLTFCPNGKNLSAVEMMHVSS